MGETGLVKADLSPDTIAVGRTLLLGLDTASLPFEAAFWLFNEESAIWHLVLAARAVRQNGSLVLYQKVDQVLTKLKLTDTIWIGMVSIIDVTAQIVQSLRKVMGTTGSVYGVRLDNTPLAGGVWIPSCVLYRLSLRQKLAAPPAGTVTTTPGPAVRKPQRPSTRRASV